MIWHLLLFGLSLSTCAIALTSSLFLSFEMVAELRRTRRPRWQMSYLQFSAARMAEEYRYLYAEMRLMGASMAAIGLALVFTTACAALLFTGKL